ncbi:hypothetical protein MHYP_G00178130 [Metynnis hypsauchen]
MCNFPGDKVSETLLRRATASLSFSPTYAHVSRPGDEIISVTVHGATSLPPLRDGGTPLPFAILLGGVDGRQRSQAVTQCPLQTTHNPCWEENLSVELLDVEAHREDVVVNVAHGPSKELLAHYRLPSAYLEPFQHYHLELVQNRRKWRIYNDYNERSPTGQCPRGCDCMLPWCVNSATSPGSPASPSLALRYCCSPWTLR